MITGCEGIQGLSQTRVRGGHGFNSMIRYEYRVVYVMKDAKRYCSYSPHMITESKYISPFILLLPL